MPVRLPNFMPFGTRQFSGLCQARIPVSARWSHRAMSRPAPRRPSICRPCRCKRSARCAFHSATTTAAVVAAAATISTVRSWPCMIRAPGYPPDRGQHLLPSSTAERSSPHPGRTRGLSHRSRSLSLSRHHTNHPAPAVRMSFRASWSVPVTSCTISWQWGRRGRQGAAEAFQKQPSSFPSAFPLPLLS